MSHIRYFEIEQEIAEILRASIQGLTVEVEAEMMFGAEMAPWAVVYLENRSADARRQSIAAGQRMDVRLTFSIWIWAFHMEMADAIRQRDDMLARAEVVLMGNRTLNGMVDTSWIEGGRLPSARVRKSSEGIDESVGFVSGAEIRLVADTRATTD